MSRSSKALPCLAFLWILACAAVIAGSEPPAPAAPQAAPAPSPSPSPETVFPARFYANIVISGGPGASGTGRMALILQRWSTLEERQAMLEALKQGGQDALVARMETSEVGRLSIDDSLGWPVRLASMRKTPGGIAIRIATDRPIAWAEYQRMARSEDYPIGFIEFTMPADGGQGEGSLLLATRVKADEAGDIVVESLPGNTAPQRLMNVRQDAAKKKKKK